MHISVWQRNLLGQPRETRSDLTMFIDEGSAFATWKHGPVTVRSSLRIPVSDELASQVLGAHRGPCSFVGQYPKYSTFGTAPGYTCRDKTETGGSAAETLERCTECGYFNVYPGNPRFRLYTGNEAGVYTHPQRTRLKAPANAVVTFTEADWDQGRGKLVPQTADGTLTVLAGALWPIKAGGRFSGSTIATEHGYTLLSNRVRSDRIDRIDN